MFGLMKRIAPILFVCVMAVMNSAFSVVQFSGEIPWPLSAQHVVTVQNSTGLWKLENKTSSRVFNVEMIADGRSGYDWIRVSELDPKTYGVISWGEGFFSPTPLSSSPQSSFSNIGLQPGSGMDSFGRYITMYPNGDLNSQPFVLRIVEVETPIGNVLGLSVIDYGKLSFEHMLGTRVLVNPLACTETETEGGLKCFLNL